MSELQAVLFILIAGFFGTCVLTTLSYFVLWLRARNHPDRVYYWPHGVFYHGVSLTWIIAAGVSYFVYP